MPVETTKNYKRYRKADPKKFDKRSFRVKSVSKNTKIIVGCPKGKYSPSRKRCKVGLKIQSILKKRKFNYEKHTGFSKPRWE